MRSTLHYLAFICLIIFICPFQSFANCTISGTVNSTASPFSTPSCDDAPGVVTITGTLNITANYDISSLTGITQIIVDGGIIDWTSNSTFTLPAGVGIQLINGGKLEPEGPGGGCNSQKQISINGSVVVVCNGNGGTHTFADVNAAGGFNGTGNLLPIELLSFSATTQTNSIALHWQTANELDNDYMAVERSRDGKHFDELGRLNGNGTSFEVQTYSFFDEKPFPGLNYYRLRQVDFDGTTSYHRVIAVMFGDEHEALLVFPTIAKEQIFINFPKPLEKEASLHLIDLTGKVLLSQNLQAATQNTSLKVNHLMNGHYFLQILSGDEIQVERFIKN